MASNYFVFTFEVKLSKVQATHGGERCQSAGNPDIAQRPGHHFLTDVVMPGINGKELFTQAAEKRPDLKTLYMPGHTENVIAHRGVSDDRY